MTWTQPIRCLCTRCGGVWDTIATLHEAPALRRVTHGQEACSRCGATWYATAPRGPWRVTEGVQKLRQLTLPWSA